MLTLECFPTNCAEKTYCAQLLLGEILGFPYRISWTGRPGAYRILTPEGAVLSMADVFFKDEMPPERLYTRARLPIPAYTSSPEAPYTPVLYGDFYLKKKDREWETGADWFASAFFMASRWEEYAVAERDPWGRFPAEHAAAVKAGFIERPVVHEYADWIARALIALGYRRPPQRRQFERVWSCDVDCPRLWTRPADRLRTLAGSLWRRKRLRECAAWLAGPIWLRQDPYDVFEAWMEMAKGLDLRLQFNILQPGPSDPCRFDIGAADFRGLLRLMAAGGHAIGFHPSREAAADKALFGAELERLRALSPTAITSGRHHYLLFEAPFTWRNWSEHELRAEASLGYAERPGFRSGMCREYPVFDFLARRPLPLLAQPLVAMDVSYALYRGDTPEAAREHLRKLREQCELHGGQFTLLWHNSSWQTPFWRPWQPVLNAALADQAESLKSA